jgi:hypothetical protein
MERHFRILGYLFIVWGAISAATLVAVGFAPEMMMRAGSRPTGSFLAAAITFSAIVAAFYIYTGIALLTRKPWARGVAIAASVITLFNFPIGTALGIYGLWVMFSSGSEQAFRTYTGAGTGPGDTWQTPV